jgi:hypothetical protein
VRAGVALLVFTLAAGALAVVLGSRGDSEQVRPEITREYLVGLGLRLGPPDPDQPVVVPRERAERVAGSAAPSPVLASVLATCHDNEDDVGYPCWVVAHDPEGFVSSGPPGTPRTPAAYFVSMIDSRTGAWVGGSMGGPGGAAASRDRASARQEVEHAILRWQGSPAACRDDVRPDFRGRPAFRCTLGHRKREWACYAIVGKNLFRMACAGAGTDFGRLVYRG